MAFFIKEGVGKVGEKTVARLIQKNQSLWLLQ